MRKKSLTNFRCACAQSGISITLAARDVADPDYSDYAGPCSIIEWTDRHWRRRKVNGWIEALALNIDGSVMAVTTEGDFIQPALDGPMARIPGRHAQGMKTIGTSVYVCGGGCAVYRLDGSGWRALAIQNLDPGSFLLHIDGLSEDQIYIISHTGVFFWDGTYAHYIKEISDHLTVAAIHIERPDIVWLCGWEGVLLRGNFRDGFARIPNPGRQMFVSIAEFQGNVYLGSTDTLWSYNGKTIAPVDLDVGERPRIWLLTRAANTLWAVGDSIYRLTSIGSWEHIPYDPL